ncbi:MAG: pyruvate ferredoxin oxidoreductase [Deltaproteobacteria bacterium]|nr:pyruvate ferredoxin oxidoreductase [Deltaproteobacteria bacterium]
MKKLITANHAAGLAATLAGRANRKGRGFGGGVYPITPQTESIEFLSRQEIEKGSVVRVESEHSAMAVCIGMASNGARTFTASSSNGLAYMTENVITAAMYRLPIVMLAVNRTLGPPWNIWVDHNDTLLLRDSGWIQLYCEDNQEAFDSLLFAYRLSEDPRVLLPTMVCIDAFVLSHTLMETDIPEQDQVDGFLPPLQMQHRISDKPRTMGGLDFPHETEVHRGQMQDAMNRVFKVYEEHQKAFEKSFGRSIDGPVVPYRTEDAEVVIVSMGTLGATAKQAVDTARERGIKAGSLRVKMFRPFPEQQLVDALKGAKKIAVIDRDLSPGMGGILWSELRGAVRTADVVQSYLIGLGGGDVRPHHLVEIFDDLAERDRPEPSILKEVA